MSKYADFVIQSEPAGARSIAEQVVQGAGFTVTWDDPATGHAQRGSLPLTVLLGAFVGKKRQSVKIDLSIFTGPQPGTTVVRLTRASLGWTAGAIGARRTEKIFNELVQDLAAPFGQAGTLLGVNQG